MKGERGNNECGTLTWVGRRYDNTGEMEGDLISIKDVRKNHKEMYYFVLT